MEWLNYSLGSITIAQALLFIAVLVVLLFILYIQGLYSEYRFKKRANYLKWPKYYISTPIYKVKMTIEIKWPDDDTILGEVYASLHRYFELPISPFKGMIIDDGWNLFKVHAVHAIIPDEDSYDESDITAFLFHKIKCKSEDEANKFIVEYKNHDWQQPRFSD